MDNRASCFAPCLILPLLLLTSRYVEAAPRSWLGTSSDVNWSTTSNWNPDGSVIASDNIRVGNLTNAAGDETIVDQNYTIATMAITNGASVDTGGNRLDVSGNILVNNSGSKLIASERVGTGSLTVVDAVDITFANGTTLEMRGGRVSADGTLTIDAGAEVFGHGTISGNGLANEGTIRAGSTSSKLHLHPSTLNLDGVSENGALEAIDGSISIERVLADPFDGTITVGGGRNVEFFHDSTIGSGGVVHLQGGTGSTAVFGGLAIGLAMVDFGGTLNVSMTGRLRNVNFLSGSTTNLAANSRLQIGGTSSAIDKGATFIGAGRVALSGGPVTMAHQATIDVPLEGTSTISELHIGAAIAAVELLTYEPHNSTRLFMQLGGPDLKDNDHITIQSLAVLDGDLEVELINGFMPRSGQSFQIMKILGQPITGQFDTVANELPTLTGDLSWQIDYSDPGHVFLHVLTPYSADFDGDGDVDGNDLTDPVDGWQARYGSDLDGADFLAWQRQFGCGVPTLAVSRAVPEPTTFVMFFFATSSIVAQMRFAPARETRQTRRG